MKSNRVLLLVLALLLVLLLGLGALFLWLTGGLDAVTDGEAAEPAGIVHVRSIYTADGESLRLPVGLDADDTGDFYVTLRDAQRVVAFERNGDWVRSFGERGVAQGQMLVATGVGVDRLADHVYVTDRSRLRLLCFTTEGEFLWEVPILNPLAPVVTSDGIAVLTFGPIGLFSSQGEVQGEVGTRGLEEGQFDYPRSGAVAENGDLVIADSNNNRVQRVKPEGETTATVVWVDGKPGRFQDDPQVAYGLPTGVTIDDQGRVYALDGFKHEIQVLDAQTGERIHSFGDLQGKGDGRFNLPTSIAHLGGDTFAITDTYNDRVQIVRLLLPGEDGLVVRFPWLWWLIPALLLGILAFVLGRKRWYVTEAALERAEAEGHLRLLAAVGRRLLVLPEVRARFESVNEDGLAIGEYLFETGESDGSDATQRLIAQATPQGWDRLLLPRVRIIVRDADELAAFEQAAGKTLTVDELVETYRIDDVNPSAAGGVSD
ncbi:MAG: hypothetical protein U1E26_04580 [Coriobacteriia bacterium]|nr:hypothetical protein [Coriobacteriia bacterium]